MKSIKCPHCGLVNFASLPACKRCGGVLEGTSDPQVRNEQGDAKLEASIKLRLTIIYGLGFMGTLALGIVAAMKTEDTTRMAGWFLGIIVVGFICTWVVASIVETRMLAGRNDFVYSTTAGQKSAVLTASLVCAFLVFNSEYGFILSPLIVVLFNVAMFIYERQQNSKRRASRS